MEKLNFIIAKNLSELRRKNKLTQLEVAEKLCDRIAIIHHGRQVYLGTLEELKAAYPDQTLENIFLEITEHA